MAVSSPNSWAFQCTVLLSSETIQESLNNLQIDQETIEQLKRKSHINSSESEAQQIPSDSGRSGIESMTTHRQTTD